MYLLWLAVISLIVLLDQATKRLAVLCLEPVSTVPLWRNVLHLTYVENTGAAFGMMKDSRWIFMTVSTVAVAYLLVRLFRDRPRSRLECLSLCFLVGGGVGNMIDRVFQGYVVDMIDFRVIRFPVFNAADSFVTVGAVMLLVSLSLSLARDRRAQRAAVPEVPEPAPETGGEGEAPAPEADGPAPETPEGGPSAGGTEDA